MYLLNSLSNSNIHQTIISVIYVCVFMFDFETPLLNKKLLILNKLIDISVNDIQLKIIKIMNICVM